MQSFEIFNKSVEPLRPKIEEAKDFDYKLMTEING